MKLGKILAINSVLPQNIIRFFLQPNSKYIQSSSPSQIYNKFKSKAKECLWDSLLKKDRKNERKVEGNNLCTFIDYLAHLILHTDYKSTTGHEVINEVIQWGKKNIGYLSHIILFCYPMRLESCYYFSIRQGELRLKDKKGLPTRE